MRINNLLQKMRVQQVDYDNKQKELHDVISLAEKELSNMEYPHWIDTILHPIGKEIARRMKFEHYSILGPFGLDCETSIHFWSGEQKKDMNNVKSITFSPGEHGANFDFFIKTSKKVKKVPKGSIAEMNGMDREKIKIPRDIVELMKYVK